MTRLMDILQIYLEQQILIKYYVITHLISLKIEYMVEINADMLQ